MPSEMIPISGGATAQQMVDKLTEALATQPIGVVSITVDGQTVTYARKDALAELREWEKRVSGAAGKRPLAVRIRMSGGYSDL